MTVSVEDWQLAGQIMDESTRVRDRCLEQMHEAVQQSKADYINDSEEARAQAESRKLEAAKRRVMTILEENAQGGEIVGYRIRQKCGKYGDMCYRALSELFEDGRIEKVGTDTGSDSSSQWTLAPEYAGL
ncbi:hypothetical protein [Bifidobacterium mongoliense]|uniref:hypothetical protein n=1 Tax=Bifidobacterium mongoliense TaxID=518643 RepID=UPI0026471EE1|nr:hypothetical protein [Bifidobacterium mongoliense]MDN5978717.1 hypothetical protein [Bifidobacterium mongoliense]MDN6802262.1 hypothetical protein [Bifidobacterium mongoliense]